MIRAFVTIIIMLPVFCFASQERIHQWDETSYKLTLPEPYGVVLLNIKFGGDNGKRTITEMNFSIGEKKFHVPKKAFIDIEDVKTDSLRIQTELHNPYNLGVGIYVVFNYGKKGQHTAHIITNDLKLVSRSLRIKTSDTTWQHKSLKF